MTNPQTIKSHFKKVDPKIYAYMKDLEFGKWLQAHRRKRDQRARFEILTQEIIAQQLSGKAADAITKRFIALFPNEKVDPQKLIDLSHQTLRKTGTSNAKITYIKDLAEKVVCGEVDLTKLDDLNDDEAMEYLMQVKGIGPWTAEMFLIFTLHREDVFSYGDVGLRRGFEKVYGLDSPSEEQVKRIVKKWAPYKSYGSIALWHSLEI